MPRPYGPCSLRCSRNVANVDTEHKNSILPRVPTARPFRLQLLDPAPPTLAQVVQTGRLVEISGDAQARDGLARVTSAVHLLRQAQLEGETAAWVQPDFGPLFPPDLEQNGIDVEALVVIQVPRKGALPQRLCKATEILLRSGAFGIVILDLTEGIPAGGDAWQGRLLGQSRQHHCRLVLLTEKPTHADSLGPWVGLRIEPRRRRESAGDFVVDPNILKNKSGTPLQLIGEHYRGPWGLR